MEVGVDIVQIERIEKLTNQAEFLKKYFSLPEIEYINSKNAKAQTIAGLYACKEAVLKAIGIGIGAGIRLNEISVLYDQNGKPYVQVTPQLNYYLNLKNCNNISLSISHERDSAVAFCTIF